MRLIAEVNHIARAAQLHGHHERSYARRSIIGMTVILDPTSWPFWLGEETVPADDRKAMSVAYPSVER
jgi:hypothetical protein